MNIKAVVLAVATLASTSAVASSELLVTTESGKGGALALGLDLVSDGTVAGFSFVLDLPGVEAKAVRSSNCVSQLPKGFSANCVFTQGKVAVIATADAMGTAIASGVQSIGSIALASGLAKGASISVVDFETSNDNGISTPGKVAVNGASAGEAVDQAENK
jgi:hypothetical protein